MCLHYTNMLVCQMIHRHEDMRKATRRTLDNEFESLYTQEINFKRLRLVEVPNWALTTRLCLV